MPIRFFDMFAGIGGFRSGLEAVGGYECIGHCEIDKYTNQAYNAIYNPKGELYFEDARTINQMTCPTSISSVRAFPHAKASRLPETARICRRYKRNSLLEVARIAEAKRPAYLLLENVPRFVIA